jgi:hypothetical protein
MDETSDQIERHIQETRNDLDHNLSELGDKVKKAVDWRAQVEERPGAMLGLAFAGGVILSALLSPGRRSRSAHTGGQKSARNEVLTPSASPSLASRPSETWQTVEAMAGALVNVAVNRASRFIDSLVPGFEREFGSAKVRKAVDPSESDFGNLAESRAPFKSAAAGAD